jgi:hypothetical protein
MECSSQASADRRAGLAAFWAVKKSRSAESPLNLSKAPEDLRTPHLSRNLIGAHRCRHVLDPNPGAVEKVIRAA